MPRDRSWDDDGIHPTKGPNRPEAFLRSNFKLSAPGASFKTVKAKFSPKMIQAEAEKAGWIIRIDDQDPWLKVTIISKKAAA